MSLNIVLLTPRRRFIANRFGLGYQIPLGLVFIGGPLVDAGHRVRLIDNDLLGLDGPRLVREISRGSPPDCILIGHTGSTAAHPVAMKTARVLKRSFPRATIVYGGVYTYRNQIIGTPRLSPGKLFFSIKLMEGLFHLRPRALFRMTLGPDRRFRRLLRAYVGVGARVILAEIWEFLFRSRRVREGCLTQIPGYPSRERKRTRESVAIS